jgi:WD40 repeat protein
MALETQNGNTGRRYAIFLSYRHDDNKEQRRQWATWLHQELEGYEIPEDLVGTTNNRGEKIPPSLYPVFRDEEELPADADLTRNIQQALERSELLVVLCSPRSAGSRFVAEEIRHFKEIGRADRILALMIDGEPNALDDSGKAKAGISPEQECLPEPLRFGVQGSDGKIDWNRRTEPIAADARPEGRPAQGWTTGAAYREALETSGERGKEISRKVRDYEQRLELAKLKVVAGALGVPLGILTDRNKAMQLRKAKQRARIMRRWLAAVGLLAILAVVGGMFAWLQRREAIRQQHEVILAFSKADTSAALERIGNDQGPEAVAYLCRALRADPENHDAASLLFSVLTTRNWFMPRENFQPEGEEIAALDANGHHVLTRKGTALRLWDLDGHRVIRELPDPESTSLTPPRFTPNGQWLILPVGDSLQKLELATGVLSPLGKAESTHAVDGFSRVFPFSPDGKQIALETDNKLQSWTLADNQPQGDPVESSSNPPVAISRDGSHLLLSASGGKTTFWDRGRVTVRNFQTQNPPKNPLRVWDAATGQPGSAELPYRASWLNSVAFSHDGGSILAATMNKKPNIHDMLGVWDAASGQPRVKAIAHDSDITAANWSADDRLILTASRNVLRIWDAATAQLAAAPLHAKDDLITAWFSPDGRRIIAPVLETTGIDFSAEPGLSLSTLDPNGAAQESFYSVKAVLTWDAAVVRPQVVTLSQPSAVLEARFSLDGRWIVTVSDKAAQIWDASSKQLKSTLEMDDVPVCVAFSPDGARLLLVSDTNTARVWNVATGEALCPPIHDDAEAAYASEHNRRGVTSIGFPGPAHPSRRVIGAFSPDGKTIALASGFGVRIWDPATGKPIAGPMRHTDYITSIAFSPDARRLLTSSLDANARQWDVATGKALGEPMHANSQIQMATFSPNGKYVATVYVATVSGDQSIRISDAFTGKAISPSIGREKGMQSVQFSPDSQRVVAFAGQTGRVWNALTGEAVSAPIVHSAPLASICFSPDGNFVLTASEDRTARVWNATTGRAISVPLLHDGIVNFAAFSADGQYVVTASEEGAARIWPIYSDIPPAWVVDFAEVLAGCNLDSTGNPSYFPGQPIDRLRQQAAQESKSTDRFVVWAREILKSDR